MDVEGVEKALQQANGSSDSHSNSIYYKPAPSRCNWAVVLVLRLVSLGATVTATLLMALNKESRSFVVGTVGTTPIKTTIKADFQHTPAFVIFVIVNAIASLHNLVILALDLLGHKLDLKGLRLLFTILTDMGTVALLSAAAGGATAMAELGKNGNSHARWNKTCDKFHSYCDRGGFALIASFAGIGALSALTALSVISLRNKTTPPRSN